MAEVIEYMYIAQDSPKNKGPQASFFHEEEVWKGSSLGLYIASQSHQRLGTL